jgi:inosose dehydratase
VIIGCFALVEPYRDLARQFQAVAELGFRHADLTDNHNGGMLGVEFGFSASASLDSHPAKIRDMAVAAGITLTSICAHANLLDPPAPDVYSTNEIVKAIRLAHDLGVSHVITTEGDPKTEFGLRLTPGQRIFAICERLHAPLQWADELGVELLLESHGIVTDSVQGMGDLLENLGHDQRLGVCLDTGNIWLGGAEPLDFIRAFGPRIKHVHWKDMPANWESRRGTQFGCGMSTIPLGSGLVGICEIVEALNVIGFDGATTLEIAGAENIRLSAQRLRGWDTDDDGKRAVAGMRIKN